MEFVGVGIDRKTLSDGIKSISIHVSFDACATLSYLMSDRFAQVIIYKCLTVVLAAVVSARAIASYNVCLVLDGTGYEQMLPCVTALNRPVGRNEQDIVGVVDIAEPRREAEVVANSQGYIPSAETHYGNPLSATSEILSLRTQAKQVRFVIEG